MRLIKMLGLAAVAAMAAMAFVGATSASATSTALCNTNAHTGEGLPCPSGQLSTTLGLMAGSGRLLSSLVTVVCDSVIVNGNVLALGNPQVIHVSGLGFNSCETSGGDGCVVSPTELPLANLLKTGLDAGIATLTNGSVLVECADAVFSPPNDIECKYDLTGLMFAVGAQHLTADDTQIDRLSGDDICPDESFLDGLLVAGAQGTGNRYILA